MSLEQIDKEFAQFARQRAEKVAPGATWEELGSAARRQFGGRGGVARKASPKASRAAGGWPRDWWSRKNGRRPRKSLEQLKALYPEYVGPDNPYLLLAIVFRRLSDPAAEHKVLEELAMRDGDAITAYLRLMELDEAAGDWRGVAKNARRFLAVNPLVPTPHRQLARAAEHSGDRDNALDGLSRRRPAR